MSGQRFNRKDTSTKAGMVLGTLSGIGLALATGAPEMAAALTATSPGTAAKVTIAGLVLSALLGAKKGR